MKEALLAVFKFETYRFKKSQFMWLFLISLGLIAVLTVMLLTKKAIDIPEFNREQLMLFYQTELINLRNVLDNGGLTVEQYKSISLKIAEYEFYLKNGTCEHDYIRAMSIMSRNPLYEGVFFSFNLMLNSTILAFGFLPIYASSVIFSNNGISSKNILMSKYSREDILISKYKYLFTFGSGLSLSSMLVGFILLFTTDVPHILFYMNGSYFSFHALTVYASFWIAVTVLSLFFTAFTNLLSLIFDNLGYGLVFSVFVIIVLFVVFLVSANAMPNAQSIVAAGNVAMYIPLISLLYFGLTGFTCGFFISLFAHLFVSALLFLFIRKKYVVRNI